MHYTFWSFKNLLLLWLSKFRIHSMAGKVDTDKNRGILVGASEACLHQRKVTMLLRLARLGIGKSYSEDWKASCIEISEACRSPTRIASLCRNQYHLHFCWAGFSFYIFFPVGGLFEHPCYNYLGGIPKASGGQIQE